MTYQPSQKLLKKYADVLIKFALNSYKGVKKGEVVYLSISEAAKPFLIPLQTAILESGAHMILGYHPEGTNKNFFKHATDTQIKWVPKDYMLSRIDTIDHLVSIIATDDKFELQNVPSEKIMMSQKSAKFYREALNKKENAGKFTWTLGLYGTEAMAKEANLTLEEYWNEIIKACFLKEKDPISKWKQVMKDIETFKNKLNKLEIDYLHVEGDDADLKVKIGPNRKWMAGSGRNIPSFEHFISPDWRGTEGWIRFNQPLYRYGNLVEGVELWFEKGKVKKVKAKKNQKLIEDMIKVKDADKIGEFSLTDSRFSKITKFMAETLFDENAGGKFGNTHLALGSAYKDSYPGDPDKVTDKQWKEWGYNDSVIHTDIVSTTDRKVTAYLADGSTKIIYKSGKFTI